MKDHSTPDMLIFDVDGVLLDVRGSFPEVIRACITKGWEKFCGGAADGNQYTDEHERILKQHGAFNDDYDLAWAMLSMSAATGAKKLSEAFPSPGKLVEEIKTFHGTVREWVVSRYGDIVPRGETRELCNELYTGTESHRGLHLLETPMLAANWKDIPLPVGIYSGRDTHEWTMGKESLGWRDFPDDMTILSDSGITKPSPRGLEILCERAGAKAPCFFGDTASDLFAYNAFGKGLFAAIGGLLPDAEYVFPDTNAAVKAMLALAGK
ncbi:MAG: HAD family hydrolase [Synergistaceae bacterium]|nr:HAD family hydrolase [Synergistaceae bacterium]